MKKTLKQIGVFILIFLFFTLCAVFIQADLKIFEWHVVARYFIVALTIFTYINLHFYLKN